MINELLRDFDGSWRTIAVLMGVVGILLKILAWLCFLLGHYVAPEGKIQKVGTWFAWSGYAMMFIAVIIFITQ